LIGLTSMSDVDVVVADKDLASLPDTDPRARILRDLPRRPGNRRIVLEYLQSPTAIHRTAAGLEVEFARNELVAAADGTAKVKPTGDVHTATAGLVLTSIGYRGRPVPDLPFDDARGTVPNDQGRVDGIAATYVTGWIKRGPTGFIGTNKSCAQETVRSLVADYNAGLLA
jgi:ferredoxin--NADP+ reductase